MRFFRVLSPGRVIFLATLLVTGYLIFSAGSNLLNSYHLASDEARLQDEVDELESELDQLQQVRDYLRTDEYVEFMARRVFGLVQPGENLVIVESPPANREGSDSSRPVDEKWWQRLFGR